MHVAGGGIGGPWADRQTDLSVSREYSDPILKIPGVTRPELPQGALCGPDLTEALEPMEPTMSHAEPVEDFLERIGAWPDMERSARFARVGEAFGTEYARLLERLSSRGYSQAKIRAVRDQMYRSLETARAVWLWDNVGLPAFLRSFSALELSPGAILDIGCGSGVLACFVALRHPERRVVGIDINAASLACARGLAAELAVDNVEFIQGDVRRAGKTMLKALGRFGVITSALTQHEIGRAFTPHPNGFSTVAAIKAAFAGTKASTLGRSVEPVLAADGLLVTMERWTDSVDLARTIAGMAHLGLAAQLEMSTRVSVGGFKAEIGGKETLPFIVFRRGTGAPSAERFIEWYLDARPSDVDCPGSLDQEMEIRRAVGIRSVKGWEIHVYDEYGPGITRKFVLEDAAGNSYWYMTTSRGARIIVKRGSGKGSAEALIEEVESENHRWGVPPRDIRTLDPAEAF